MNWIKFSEVMSNSRLFGGGSFRAAADGVIATDAEDVKRQM